MFAIYNNGELSKVTGNYTVHFEDGSIRHVTDSISLDFRTYLNVYDVIRYHNGHYDSYLGTVAIAYMDEDYPYSQSYSIANIVEWFPDVWGKFIMDHGPIAYEFYNDDRWNRKDRYHDSHGYMSDNDYDNLMWALSEYWTNQIDDMSIYNDMRQSIESDKANNIRLDSMVDDLRQYLSKDDMIQYLNTMRYEESLNYVLNGELVQTELYNAMEQFQEVIYVDEFYDGFELITKVVVEFDHPECGQCHLTFNLESNDYVLSVTRNGLTE